MGVIKSIQKNIQEKKYGPECMLLLDEMSLKKALGYDPKLKNYIGVCTITDPEEQEEILATQLLVFMLVSLDGLWRQPLGYWFTHHENASNLSNLVDEGLRLTHENDIEIAGIVFDGAATNIAMSNKMGANLCIQNMKNWFHHPVTHAKVYIFPDACHMLKLVRNLLGEKEELFLDGFEHPVKMVHFKALVEHQEETGFRSGNRLTWEHVNYQNHIMKVLYATQLLSGSSASSLEDAKIDGFDPRLDDCETTVYFCRMIDKLFDFCNSRSPKATGQRAALTPENYDRKKEEMLGIISVLEKIRVKEQQVDKKTKTTKTVESAVAIGNKKTCILGFKTTVNSIFDLARQLFDRKDNPTTKFYTYLVQQDYLEPFFSLIRHHDGWKDNPTPLQIKYIMRKLIVIKCGGLSTSLHMNCSTVHIDMEIEISEDLPDNMEVIVELAEQLSGEQTSQVVVLDKFKRRVLCHIGGYVANKLAPQVGCHVCKAALFNSEGDKLDPADERLIKIKDKGGKLKSPSNSTFNVILKAEEVFQTEIIGKKRSPVIEKVNDYLTLKVIRLLDTSKLFPTLDSHALQQNPALEDVHSVVLI